MKTEIAKRKTKMTTPQQRLEEIAAQEQAFANEKKKLLEVSKDADLERAKNCASNKDWQRIDSAG